MALDATQVTPPHLDLLDDLLVRIDRGEEVRAIVSMPPRHGKSLRLSHYGPAWLLLRNPDRRIILCSYEADFAASWGRAVRNTISSHPDIFPHAVARDAAAQNRWLLAGRKGGMTTAGVRGAITGKGADVMLVDDPVKNAEEARSATMKAGAWDWWTSTAYSRLEPGASAVVVMTRWAEDDLAGKILEHEPDVWEYIRLPAIAEANDPLGRPEGAALWPARYDEEALAKIKRTQGGYWWSALYQGRPAPDGGGYFHRQDLRYYPDPGSGPLVLDGRVATVRRRYAVVDLAASLKERADYTVISTFDYTETGDLVWRDMVRVRLEGPDQVPTIRAAHQKWGGEHPVYIESAGFQLTVIQAARRARLPVMSLKADGDKLARSFPAQALAQGGKLWLPAGAPWLADAEAELVGFPNAEHDDIVDTVSYAALVPLVKGTGRVRSLMPQ